MIIPFSSGTVKVRQAEYFGVQSAFYFPASEGDVMVYTPSRRYIIPGKPMRFIVEEKPMRFIV